MDSWLRANPTLARKSNWERFIVNWLKREQDRGGDARTSGRRQPAADDRAIREYAGDPGEAARL
jgi:hypothetical protein